jgi:hypothetical protein
MPITQYEKAAVKDCLPFQGEDEVNGKDDCGLGPFMSFYKESSCRPRVLTKVLKKFDLALTPPHRRPLTKLIEQPPTH